MTPPSVPWRLVVPVKDQALAKSRLHPPADVLRADLAHAFALDTLGSVFVAMPATRVTVVSSDRPLGEFARQQGALVEPDPGLGLNPALESGLRRVCAEPWDGPTAILLGDLPALVPDELTAALDRCSEHERAVVPDRSGTGTVLLTALRRAVLVPRFGPGSAQAHAAESRRLDLDLATLRTDVDDDISLRAAATLGLGPRTTAVLAGRR